MIWSYLVEMFKPLLSVTKCQWYRCPRKTSSKSVVQVLTGSPSKSICLFRRKCLVYRTQCRYMSTNNGSVPENQSNVEKLLEDATVPEEMPVEGDTENWTTTPYPKGLNYFFRIALVHLELHTIFIFRFICTS